MIGRNDHAPPHYCTDEGQHTAMIRLVPGLNGKCQRNELIKTINRKRLLEYFRKQQWSGGRGGEGGCNNTDTRISFLNWKYHTNSQTKLHQIVRFLSIFYIDTFNP